LTNKVFLHHLMSCNNVSLCSVSGAQPALKFGGGNFHVISFDDAIVRIQRGTTTQPGPALSSAYGAQCKT